MEEVMGGSRTALCPPYVYFPVAVFAAETLKR